jgi:hypothetical protein
VIAPSPAPAQEARFRITEIAADESGRVRVQFPAEADSYYILLHGHALTRVATPVRMTLGVPGSGEFLHPVEPGAAGFYKVQRVPVNQPLDTDGDGIDDVYELQRPSAFDPLSATDTQRNFLRDAQGNFVKYEPLPTTRILSPDETTGIQPIAEDGTLTIAASSPAATSLAVGQVIVAGISPATPQGLLRVVLEMKSDASGNHVLTTALAPLQLAFRTLHVRTAGTVDPFTEASPLRLVDDPDRWAAPAGGAAAAGTRGGIEPRDVFEKSKTFQVVVFDGDGNRATSQDQVTIDAELSGGFDFELAIDFDWGAIAELPNAVLQCVESFKDVLVGQPPRCSPEDLLPELKLTFGVEPKLGAAVGATGAAVLGFDKEFDVGTIDLPPIPIGFLVFLPSVDIVASVSGNASAKFSVGAHASVHLQSRAVLSSKRDNSSLVPVSVKEADAEAEPATVDLHAKLTASVGARLNMALYGVVGPYATASAFTELEADPLGDPCWNLKLGVEGEVGVRVTTPKLPLLGYITLLDWRAPPFRILERIVASGACATSPEDPRPPGTGPSAQALQNPSFTPWARVLGGPVDGTSVIDVNSFAFASPFLAPSIDGRYIAGGGGSLGLIKLDDRNGGSLTWATRILPTIPFSRPLKSLASVPSGDAGLVTLFRPGNSAAFVLAKQSQSGAYEIVRSYELSEDCVAIPTLLARDTDGGYVVAGYCRANGDAWIAEVDHSLHLVRARIVVDTDPDSIRLQPSVAVRTGQDLLLAGDRLRAGQPVGEANQMFLMRLDPAGHAASAVSYSCRDRFGLFPTAGALSADDSVTLVGDATGASFITRVRKDNTLGWINFPRVGSGIRDWFVPSSVAELPTTGLIVGYSSGTLAGAPPAVALLGLDGAGRTLWGNAYELELDGSTRAMAWPALRITDDGGVLVTATAAPATGATEGGALVAIKVFAKNGHLGDNQTVTRTALEPTDASFTVTPYPFAPVMLESSVAEQPLDFVP